MTQVFTIGRVESMFAGNATFSTSVTVNKQTFVCPPAYAASMLVVAADARRSSGTVQIDYDDAIFPFTIITIQAA